MLVLNMCHLQDTVRAMPWGRHISRNRTISDIQFNLHILILNRGPVQSQEARGMFKNFETILPKMTQPLPRE